MAYTVSNLIADAYYVSGIVSREFETVSGQQGNLGLRVLNNILSDKAIEKDMIPYYLKYTFQAVGSQSTYFIPNLEEADTLVFYLNSVRFQTNPVGRIAFRGSSRAENVTSLPFTWNLERCLGGSNISLYFVPNVAYPMELWGLFRLGSMTMNQDLAFLGSKAELGELILTGAGTLGPGQLVVDGVDLEGAYTNPTDLLSYVNSGVIPGVTATYIAGDFTLSKEATNSTILIVSNGIADPADSITFANFSTTDGANARTFVSTGLDEFYVTYLKFSLADRLCTEYNFIVPAGVQKQLEQYQRWISKRSGSPDLALQKVSTLGGQNGINYAAANLGRGWWPSR